MSSAALAAAYQHCQQVTRAQAHNFYYAFITLPRHQRQAMYAAYALCRLCDDIADEPLPLEEKVLRLGRVHLAVEQTYAGHPQGPVFTALADAALAFHIPQQCFQELVQGVEMDLTQSRYQTFQDLRTYCYRVASTVGLICVHVFGYRQPAALEYAVDLGLAMQLTNILRDIQEDAARGRIYLPQEEMERFGYQEQELLAGVANTPFEKLMRFQVQRARSYFESGKRLIPLLPLRSRACPAVLGGMYSRILDRIEARGYNVFNGRVSLTAREKLLLMLRLWSQSLVPVARLNTAW
ncbi:MAG: presqualene diphosphate synthase HpnD [Chloroflexi bacterium]|nr:presqualene diphosphate synthase HpnD [Chloroflexota bacterium]